MFRKKKISSESSEAGDAPEGRKNRLKNCESNRELQKRDILANCSGWRMR
jgi:hypothetical protein